ncbi:hypothetical protein ACFOHT_05555 [Massilia oculi]|uniref:hypothetical protein n=1 Tax=Massilia oculi TaxID=945844 RepID=UPI001E33E40A|nr:hypothetical protein [Massilia oculi]
MQAAYGREADGFSQNYLVDRKDSNSDRRKHGDSDNYWLGGKLFLTSKDRSRTGVLMLRTYEHDADEAGFLTVATPMRCRAISRRRRRSRTTTATNSTTSAPVCMR